MIDGRWLPGDTAMTQLTFVTGGDVVVVFAGSSNAIVTAATAAANVAVVKAGWAPSNG